jgi:hypothetical protein
MPSVKALDAALVGIGGLVSAVPGVKVFMDTAPIPPDAKPFFTVAMQGAVALTAVMVLIERATSTPQPSGGRRAAWVGALALLLLLVYWAFSSATIKPHDYYAPRPDTVLIPPFPAKWSAPGLDSLVACVTTPFDACDVAAVSESYSTDDVADAVTRYGPPLIDDYISPAAKQVTRMVLLLLAVLFVVALTYALTRGAWHLRDEKA